MCLVVQMAVRADMALLCVQPGSFQKMCSQPYFVMAQGTRERGRRATVGSVSSTIHVDVSMFAFN